MQRLQHHPNWLGVKECTGNTRIQSYADQGIICWSGNDDEAHDGRHNHGAQVIEHARSNRLQTLLHVLLCMLRTSSLHALLLTWT